MYNKMKTETKPNEKYPSSNIELIKNRRKKKENYVTVHFPSQTRALQHKVAELSKCYGPKPHLLVQLCGLAGKTHRASD